METQKHRNMGTWELVKYSEPGNPNLGNQNLFLFLYSPNEEFALGIDPKSLHATVLLQTVYNAVVRHSRGFLKHVVMSITE